jgi:hypothetical protein
MENPLVMQHDQSGRQSMQASPELRPDPRLIETPEPLVLVASREHLRQQMSAAAVHNHVVALIIGAESLQVGKVFGRAR